MGMGLSVQILEREQEINLPDLGSEWYKTCKNWNEYKAGKQDIYAQMGSGL